MSNITRSYSTPVLAVDTASASTSASTSFTTKSTSYVDVAHEPRSYARRERTRTAPGALQSSQPTSPLKERGNPFNLDGFFPSSNDTDWAWLKNEEEAEEEHAHALFAVPESGEGEDEIAHGALTKVIQKEDKMGVLSLDMHAVFAMRHGVRPDVDAALLTPYSGEDPTDHDGLWHSHCARRRAHNVLPPTHKAPVASATSVLFYPSDEEDVEEGWLDGLRRVVWMS